MECENSKDKIDFLFFETRRLAIILIGNMQMFVEKEVNFINLHLKIQIWVFSKAVNPYHTISSSPATL